MVLLFNNTTLDHGEDIFGPPRWLLTVFSVILCCLCVASTAVNIICFVLFTKNRELLASPANKLVFNFIISTLATSVLVMPTTFISYASSGWILKDFLCQATGIASVAMPIAQLLTLGSMAYDRYHFIVNPLTYAINLTSFKANVIIFFTWFVAIVSSLMPLFGWGVYQINDGILTCTVQWALSSGFSIYFCAVSLLIPLTVQLYCYAGIVRVAKKQARFGRRLSRVAAVPIQATKIIRETSAAKTIRKTCIVMGFFVLTWMPYLLLVVINGTSQGLNVQTPLFVTSCLTHLSSLVYPLLFVFRAKNLKKDLRVLLRSQLFFDCVNDVSPSDIDSSERKERRLSSLSLDGYDLGSRRRSSRVSKVSWAMPMVIEDAHEPSKLPRPSITESTMITDASSIQGGILLPGELDYSNCKVNNNHC